LIQCDCWTYGIECDGVHPKVKKEDIKTALVNYDYRGLEEFFTICGQIAQLKGWNDKAITDETISSELMLVVSEAAEALDAYRKN